MNNPLIAEREDSTKSFSGIQLAESVDETKKGIENGDWASAVLGSVTTALGGLSAAMDPLGELIASGVGWLMEHVGPVSNALDELTGDADQVKAHGRTWQNIADELGKARTDLENMVDKDLADWSGEAADAYRKRSADNAKLLEAAQKAAEGASNGTNKAGEVVATVRTVVRDLLSDLAGHLVSWGLQVAATLGIALTWVIPQVVSKVAEVASQIAKVTTKLVRALGKLSPMLRKLGESFGRATDAFKNIKNAKGGSSGANTTSPNSAKGFDPPAPNTKKGPDSPDTTSPQSGPKVDPPAPNANKGDAPDTTSPQSGPKVDPPAPNGAKPNSSGNSSTVPSSSVRNNNKHPNENDKGLGQRTCRGDPIDVATGRMVLAESDVELAAALPLVLARTHVSGYAAGRSFGRAWACTWDQRIELAEDGLHVALDDGRLLTYPVPISEDPVFPLSGPRWPLRSTPDGYVITDVDAGRMLLFSGASPEEWLLESVVDRGDNRIDLYRGQGGTPVGLHHSGGYWIAVDASEGLITGLRLLDVAGGPDIPLVGYRYDEHRQLTEVLNSSGDPLRFEHDSEGRVSGWQDRNDVWYRYAFDAAGRCVRGTGPGGYLSCALSYDRDELVTKVADSLGHVTTYQLDERLRVVGETDPLGNTTTSAFDPFDRLLSRTDPLGRTTRYERDEAGNLVAIVGPDGTREQTAYDHRGLPISVTRPDGAVWCYEHDEVGKLVRAIDPLGAATRYDYDARGNLAEITDAHGGVQRIESDAAGLPGAVTDELGATTRWERDGFGRPRAVTDPLGRVTRTAWTADGDPASQTGPDGAEQRWKHDGEGNEVESVDARGEATRVEYGHFDLPVAEIAADGSRLTYGYDTELRLVTVTNERGQVWEYTYDAVGNLVRESDFNGRVQRYGYDAAGQLVERDNGAGEVVRIERDLCGRITATRSDRRVSTFDYDAAGRMVLARNADAEVRFTYDTAGRVLGESINGRTVVSEYDALGRRTFRSTPSGHECRFEYDPTGEVIALRTGDRAVHFERDRNGREVRRDVGDGVELHQAWDDNERLASQTITSRGQDSPVQHRQYGYLPDGHLSRVDDALSGSRALDIDRNGRVRAVRGHGWTESYAYDSTGALSTAEWPAMPGHPALGAREYAGTFLVAAGDLRYRYDSAGRTVSRQRRNAGGGNDVWSYHWDADDQLTGVVTPDGQRWHYRYDALGRRIAKQRVGPDGRFAEQWEFAWDGVELAEQVHGVAGHPPMATTWEREPGQGRLVAQVERALGPQESADRLHQRFHAVVTDLVGSPSELLDETGAVAWHLRTNLWGRVLSSPGSAYTPLRFPGQYYDPETGLHYNYFRYYDPDTARYLSHDPLGLEPASDPMSYVDNPTARIDPLGLAPCKPNASGGGPASTSSSRSRYPDGVYGSRVREQGRLSQRYARPINGQRFQHEHVAPNEVLIRHSGAARRGANAHARYNENHAPAYQEVREAHRAHDGTGTRNRTNGSFGSSAAYRTSQDAALRENRPGNVVQLNQLDYAHQAAFRRTTGTMEGRIADDSFDHMVRNMRHHGIQYADRPGQNASTRPLNLHEEVESRLARRAIRRGRPPSYEEELDMLHRTAYRR